MVLICQDCGQEFLSSSEYKRHQQTHLQTHLDKWSKKEEPKSFPPPQGLNIALYKIFEKYKMADKAIRRGKLIQRFVSLLVNWNY